MCNGHVDLAPYALNLQPYTHETYLDQHGVFAHAPDLAAPGWSHTAGQATGGISGVPATDRLCATRPFFIDGIPALGTTILFNPDAAHPTLSQL